MAKYKYYYTNKEANFGKPIKTEVPWGTHLTFEVVMRRGNKIFALRLPEGLHDGPKNDLYFPHGLICFGETVDQCVKRLVSDQVGMEVLSVKLYHLDSWIDKINHWHLALNVIAEVMGEPIIPTHVSEVVAFSKENIPEMAWWTRGDLVNLFKELNQ